MVRISPLSAAVSQRFHLGLLVAVALATIPGTASAQGAPPIEPGPPPGSPATGAPASQPTSPVNTPPPGAPGVPAPLSPPAAPPVSGPAPAYPGAPAGTLPPPGYGPPPGYAPAPPYGYTPGWDPRFVELWGPYGTAPYAPKTLSWEEGEPIPPGYQLESKFSKPLFITGVAMLGGGWLISSAMAASLDDSDFTPLVIPMAGPFVTISTAKSEGAGTYVLIIDGVVQTGGLVLMLAGLLVDLPYLERIGQAGVPRVDITSQGGALTWAF